MATPHRCPVCNGVGKVPAGFYSMGIASTTSMPETCRSCNGTGIIWELCDCVSKMLESPPMVQPKNPSTGDPLPPENPTVC